MSRVPTGKSLVVAILLALVVVVHVVVVSSILSEGRPLIWPLHNDTVHRIGPAADFYAVYHAGVATGRGIDPYAGVDDGVTPYWYPFRYLPVVGFLARPLTWLAPFPAFTLWVALLELLLVVLVIVLWRRIPEWWLRPTLTGLLLLSTPFFLELYMGQFTFAAVALCCLAVMLPWGVPWYALAVLLKPLVLAAVPGLVLERRFRWHLAVAVGVLILTTLPYFLQHPERARYFYHMNFVLRGGLDAGNHGLVRLVDLLAVDLHLDSLRAHWDTWVAASRSTVLGVTALLVLLSRRRAVIVRVAALLLAHFLTYQHVWEHHMSAVVVLGAVLLTVPDRSRARTGVILFALLLLVLPTPFVWLDAAKDPRVWDPSVSWPRWGSYLTVLAKVVPTAALFVLVVTDLARAGLQSPRAVVATWKQRETGSVDGG